MNDFNVFSYMDANFMHMFDEKIAHVRPLRAADFDDENANVEGHESQEKIRAPEDPSPPKLLVSLQSLITC
jgi:hypothetical protein